MPEIRIKELSLFSVQYIKKNTEMRCLLDSNANQVPSANSFNMALFRQVVKNLNHDKG